MKIRKKAMNIKKISLKFKNLMGKGNVKGALKVLTENVSNGILPLTDKTLKMLKQKHPEANEPPHPHRNIITRNNTNCSPNII